MQKMGVMKGFVALAPWFFHTDRQAVVLPRESSLVKEENSSLLHSASPHPSLSLNVVSADFQKWASPALWKTKGSPAISPTISALPERVFGEEKPSII